jgi:hypothetical protein
LAGPALADFLVLGPSLEILDNRSSTTPCDDPDNIVVAVFELSVSCKRWYEYELSWC